MRVIELSLLAHLASSVCGLALGQQQSEKFGLNADWKRNNLVQARKNGSPTSSSVALANPTADTNAWKNMQCSQIQGDTKQQWEEANAKAAWDTTLAAWETDPNGGFPQYISNYLHGPSGMRCTDISSENRCSQPVDCQDATIPAGAMILNGFAGIHQLHASAYQAIETVQIDVTDQSGTFTSTFAPQPPDNSLLEKNIFDACNLVFSFGISMIFNVALKNMESLILKGIAGDMTSAVQSTVGTYWKTNMKGAVEGLKAQNTIASYLGETMSTWKDLEAQYLQSIFSGTEGSNGTDALYALIDNGSMTKVAGNLDLSGTSNQVKKIVYGQMIPYAWSVSPSGSRPFIWQSDEDCDGSTKSIPESASYLITDDTAVKTNVCYRGKIHYVLNAHKNAGDSFRTMPLPGGDHTTLDGSAWGGIILEDIVESSVEGWIANNNHNGYPRPDTDKIVTNFGSVVPSVRTAGFFNLPVCGNVSAINQSLQNGDGNSPYWPCDAPEGYTSSGTNIHVSSGCIVINDAKRCQTWGGPYNVADQNQGNSTATIYAQFDGDNTLNQKVTPGCKIQPSWPRGYGDLDFTDNCLRDRNGQKIECCSSGTTTTDVVENPYAK
ncbi:unnamed protein product [Penicillium manginii]